MFTPNTRTLRTMAVTSALAVGATGALLAAPASAAVTDELTYTCTVLGNPQTFTGTHTMAETVQYGGIVDVTSAVTIPQSLSEFLYLGGFRQADGTVKNYATATVGAVTSPVESPGVVPKTDIQPAGPTTFLAKGGPSLAPFAPATPAGTEINVSLQDRKQEDGTTEASDLDASLYTYNEAGTQAGPVNIPCELQDSQDLTIGSVMVVKAVTKATPKLVYKKRKDVLIGKVTVKAPKSAVAPVGDVKLTVKRNGKKIKNVTVALKDGKASVKVPGKKGNYKLVTKYLGDDNFDGSKAAAEKKLAK